MTATLPVTIVVMAKPPTVAKSRLRSECDPEVGDALAEAMLLDTLGAVSDSSAEHRIVAIEGAVGDWLPDGFRVVTQRGNDLAQRLAAVFDDVGGPTLVIAIDTPQVTGDLLDDAMTRLLDDGIDAVLGPATDGGYWTIGLRSSDPRVFDDIAMSTPRTRAAQLRRLFELELVAEILPELRDIDTMADALVVAANAPETRLAATLSRLTAEKR